VTTTVHYVRQSLQSPDRPDSRRRHALRAGSNYSVCGQVSRLELDTGSTSALPPDCPACAKALEAQHDN
jgi:hypothetical protein